MENNKLKTVFMFSGQGGQYRGMGQSLFENNKVFKQSLEKSELIVQRLLDRSLIKELYYSADKKFDDLLITHPAILATEIALIKVMEELGIKPDYVTGNSLGEYAACVASEVWSENIALETCIEQAKCVVNNSPPGGMLSIISKRSEFIQGLYLRRNLILAADNFDGHFTVSGLLDDLHLFEKDLEKNDIPYFRLPIKFPFHSPFINDCQNGFALHMSTVFPLSKPKSGFISGVTSRELSEVPENYFWEIAKGHSNFPLIVDLLEKVGPCLYIDLGTSGTMATFVKYNLPVHSESKIYSILTPYKGELQQLKKVIEYFQN